MISDRDNDKRVIKQMTGNRYDTLNLYVTIN
jgi:hypothetical protein